MKETNASGIHFQPIEPIKAGFALVQQLALVFRAADPEPAPWGTIWKLYRNHPEMIPGQPVWTFVPEHRPNTGIIESTLSEDDLKSKLLELSSRLATDEH